MIKTADVAPMKNVQKRMDTVTVAKRAILVRRALLLVTNQTACHHCRAIPRAPLVLYAKMDTGVLCAKRNASKTHADVQNVTR